MASRPKEGPDVDQIENGNHLMHTVTTNDIAAHDHRANDDRAEVALGRNADKFDPKVPPPKPLYWTSVNFIVGYRELRCTMIIALMV
ncbi:hypothetical protein LTR10_010130 [Elasticomyces elasticus]|nr:hypothetical protein LTR10_010130 [Elasticomyces elasticus]KAK4970420.1 hypothetical protein LTR42_008589 [Elasticomyces elasticus]